MPYVSTMPSGMAYEQQYGMAGGKGGAAGGGIIVGPNGGIVAGGGAAGAGAGCIGGPEVACGGAGMLCCEAEGAVTSANWVYTGAGAGAYNPITNYSYVGAGCGTYDKQVTVTYYGWKFRQCCFVLCPLLLLIPLILLLIFILVPPEPTTSPITQQVVVVQPPKYCIIYGDPHVKTFDKMFSDYYTCGEYFLVKSSTVVIQGKFGSLPVTNGLAVTEQIAVGGAFLKGNKLIVGPTFVKWNNQPILLGFPSSFSNEFVSLEYNSIGDTMQKGRVGKAMKVVHIKLNGVPGGIQIQVNQWNEAGEGAYINVKITMVPQPGQDGICGNFNGNAADDDRLQVRARLGTQGVPAGEVMFEGGKTPINPSTRPDISTCPQKKLEHARALCKAKEKKWNPSKQCLMDVCFAGDMFAEEDIE